MFDFKISIVTPTLNNAGIISEFFKCLKGQNYLKKNLEILIVDGGSSDETVKIAEQYGAKIINNPYILAEPAVNIGIKEAKGEVVVLLAVDNFLEDSDSLKKIERVFDNPEIYAAFPKQDSDQSDTIFSKYVNTFTDPFNHFVYGNACNSRTFKMVYKILEHNELYDIYDYFSKSIKPVIAFAQGFAIRGGYERSETDAFDDVLPIIKLIEGNKKIAYIHSLSLYHHTIRSMSHFIKKQRWATRNALSKKKYGIGYRLKYLTPGQKLRILIWPLYAFSIILPALRSLYGLVRNRETIWLLHPLMCFVSATSSAMEYFNYILDKRKIISRQ